MLSSEPASDRIVKVAVNIRYDEARGLQYDLVSESVYMCTLVVNPVGNHKLVPLKVICVIKQRKKKIGVYFSLSKHILQTRAVRFYFRRRHIFIYYRSEWCRAYIIYRATIKYDLLPLSLNL
jgi:hypothetical protein